LEKSIKEVSQETGITVRAINLAITENRLPARRIGFFWVIDTSNPKYQQFLDDHQKWLQARGKEKQE